MPNNLTVATNEELILDGQSDLNHFESITNKGVMLFSFSEGKPVQTVNCNTSPNISEGTLVVTHDGSEIATGFYPLISSEAPLTLNDLGGYQLPMPNDAVASWELFSNGKELGVCVVQRPRAHL